MTIDKDPSDYEDQVQEAIEASREGPAVTHMFKGVGVADLVTSWMASEGKLVTLSNEGDLHRIRAGFLANFEPHTDEFIEHLRAIKSGHSTLHLQAMSMVPNDLLEFEQRLKEQLEHLGGFGELDYERMDPDQFDGKIGPGTYPTGDGDEPSYVMRLNVRVTKYDPTED